MILANIIFLHLILVIYFDLYIDDYFEYLFSPKNIVIDEKEIQLPNGYYYSKSKQLQPNETEIIIKNYKLKRIKIDYIVGQDDCEEKLLNYVNYFKFQHSDPLCQYKTISYRCKFNDSDVYVVKRPRFVSIIGFVDDLRILIPAKCMKIEIYGRDISKKILFDLIELIAFDTKDTNIVFFEWK